MADVVRISAQEASDKLKEGFTYVDVRTPQEFEEGHPAGAINVPVNDPDFGRAMATSFAKDAKIVVGCKQGPRSFRAAQMLLAAGFTNVLDQRGGWSGGRNAFGQMVEPGWAAAGLPAETGQPAGRSWADVKAKI